MATRRRWLQFSLRGFLVVLTAFAGWLGVIVNRAREQREAVKAIEAMGGTIVYDWHGDHKCSYSKSDGRWHLTFSSKRSGPTWIRELTQQVEEVHFLVPSPEANSHVHESIPHLQRLGPRFGFIYLEAPVSDEVYEEVKRALPKCHLRDSLHRN